MAVRLRPTKPFDVCEIVVVGEEGVGRRSIISKYTNDDKPFTDSKLKRKAIELDSETIEIKVSYEDIHDKNWQDLFGWGILLVYDVTNNKSFESIKNLDGVHRFATRSLLVGNKVDLEIQRVVPKEKGEQLAQEGNISFLETSAVTGSNIDKAFEIIVRNIKKYHLEEPVLKKFHSDEHSDSGSPSSPPLGPLALPLLDLLDLPLLPSAPPMSLPLLPSRPSAPMMSLRLKHKRRGPPSFLLRDEHETHIDTGSDKNEELAPNIVLAEKNVSFTSDANNTVNLQKCGLSLFFPQEVITTPFESQTPVSYNVTVKGLWAGQFVFPEGTQLISSVTSVTLNSPLPLAKPVTVQLMHCASITDQSQSKYLSFVVSHSDEPPFKFDLLPGGDFLAGSKYGTIQLKEFSLIAIVLVVSATAAIATAIGYKLLQVPLLRCQGLIYYKREYWKLKMNFAVLNDLPHNNAIIKFKNESYTKFGEEEWNFPFLMRKESQLELDFSQDKPIGWTVQPLMEPSIIHERDIRAYTESNTSSDLPPYISVLLQAAEGAAEWLHYRIPVNGINVGDKDSIAIVIRKSKSDCAPFLPALEPAPAVSEKSNAASEVFREKIFTLSSIIGSGTSTIFDRISDEFLSAGLISQSILDDITTVPSYSNYQRGSRLIRELHKRLQTIDAPTHNLIVVCDILTKQEDEQLVQIGEDMKKNVPHAV